jgi:hypothetical protein
LTSPAAPASSSGFSGAPFGDSLKSPHKKYASSRPVFSEIIDALGELPAEEQPFIARGQAGVEVDRIIQRIRTQS